MSEQSTQRPQRPARITALVSLVDRLAADPLTAHLVTENTGIWQAGLNGISLIQHADPKTASDVLRVVGDLIGAEFVAGRPAGYGELVTYEAEGVWAGLPVKLYLFAPGQTDRLRTRVAELEAELATERATAAGESRIEALETAGRSAAVLLRSVADRSEVGLPPNTPMLRSAATDLDRIAGGEPDGDRR